MSRIGLALVMSACVDLERPGTQTGPETSLGIRDACEPGERVAIAVDAPVEGVGKPSDVVALASGAFAGPFDEAGDVTASLTVAARPGDAARVTWTPKPEAPEGVACPTFLEAPISVRWATSDGALRESFDAALTISPEAPDAPWIFEVLPSSSVEGTARPTGVPPEDWVTGTVELGAWYGADVWTAYATLQAGELVESAGYGDLTRE